MKGRIALDEEYIKCVRLARVSHLSRTCFAPVSLYRARQVRNWFETGATLVREIDKSSSNDLPVFYLLFLSGIRIIRKYFEFYMPFFKTIVIWVCMVDWMLKAYIKGFIKGKTQKVPIHYKKNALSMLA